MCVISCILVCSPAGDLDCLVVAAGFVPVSKCTLRWLSFTDLCRIPDYAFRCWNAASGIDVLGLLCTLPCSKFRLHIDIG